MCALSSINIPLTYAGAKQVSWVGVVTSLISVIGPSCFLSGEAGTTNRLHAGTRHEPGSELEHKIDMRWAYGCPGSIHVVNGTRFQVSTIRDKTTDSIRLGSTAGTYCSAFEAQNGVAQSGRHELGNFDTFRQIIVFVPDVALTFSYLRKTSAAGCTTCGTLFKR